MRFFSIFLAVVLASGNLAFAQDIAQNPVQETGQEVKPDTATTTQTAAKETADKPAKPKRKIIGRLQKRDNSTETVPAEAMPILDEIMRLKWDVLPQEPEAVDDSKKISLEKIFHETLKHSIPVRQAAVQIKAVETQAKEIRDPGLFNLLNPLLDTNALKKAAENHVAAARFRLIAVRQKTLLDSARMHADLTQAFLNKYLAYQAIEQGKGQWKAEQRRFEAGETTSFEVTQTQIALIDRYGKYLAAGNAYHTASVVLANQVAMAPEHILIPEGYILEDGTATVPPLNLLPGDLNLEKVLVLVKIRPELQELQHKQTSLAHLVKVAVGLDKEKKVAELRQVELETQRAANAAAVMAEKAYGDYRTADKNVVLAKQRYELSSRFVHQLQVSYDAGFSSFKEVLDGQIEQAKAKTALMSAQVAYNLSQLQLVYEMGLLSEEIFARPLTIPPNAL